MLSLNSASAICRLFLSAPFLHIALSWCLPFNDLHGTSMSHCEHLGWGRFPSYKMITISRTCRLQKFIRIVVLVPARPGQPFTGQLCGPPLVRKASRYVRGSPPMAEAYQLHRSYVACPCCVILWDDNDPAAISFPHSLHCTCSFCHSWYIGPYSVIFLPYAATYCVPAAWHVRQTILTVFLTLVCRPTRSNKLTSVWNAHCSQRGLDDATMPSSA